MGSGGFVTSLVGHLAVMSVTKGSLIRPLSPALLISRFCWPTSLAR